MLIFFGVFLAQLFISPYWHGRADYAVGIAAAASFAGMGLLLAWAYRRWFLYVTVLLIVVMFVGWMGARSLLWSDAKGILQKLLWCLAIVLPLWGWIVHLQFTIKKKLREKGGRQ